MSKKLLIAIIVLLVAVCGVSTYIHIKNKNESEENKKTYETVAAEVAATEDSTAVSATEAAVNPYTDNTVSANDGTGSASGNYQSYTTTMNASANPDMVGWIKINDTNINYPVMQTKSNPDLYLQSSYCSLLISPLEWLSYFLCHSLIAIFSLSDAQFSSVKRKLYKSSKADSVNS